MTSARLEYSQFLVIYGIDSEQVTSVLNFTDVT